MDCQTELRISTVTYFSTSRAPQSSGPFLPFPLPFLPMTRLRGPKVDGHTASVEKQNVKASFQYCRGLFRIQRRWGPDGYH